MADDIGIDSWLTNHDRWQLIDVRSPGEFEAGHIPGAVNIPLFDDEERARVGTLYKQASPAAAMREGLVIAGAKMSSIVDAVHDIPGIGQKQALIHCWRGGKRSQAVHWLLNFAGTHAFRLVGGYKGYRNALQDFFLKNKFNLNIIGGHTGAGKTEVIHELLLLGEQAIDLEALANHRGSAFGSIGLGEQPTNEQFENDLFECFRMFTPSRVVWLENESKNIGRIYLPEGLWRKMRNSRLFHLEVDSARRLKRIIECYYSNGEETLEDLREAFHKIQRRLGGLTYKQALEALDRHDLESAGNYALMYYDKTYSFQLHDWPKEKVIYLNGCDEPEIAAKKLIEQFSLLQVVTHKPIA